MHFRPDVHFIDATATSSLPLDGPQDVHAIWTKGEGNCLTRSLSIAFCGDDSMYLEIRAHIVIEGAIN